MFSSLLFNILLFYAILVLVNIPAPFVGLKFEEETNQRLWYEPPGYLIGIVWFVLFTLLGIARHSLLQAGLPGLQGWLFALAFLCASYAYYTLGLAKLTSLSALWFGFFGNIVVILLALFAFAKLLPRSKEAAWLTAPLILWTIFATLLVLGKMKQENLLPQ